MKMNIKITPIVKWVGGKRQLLKDIQEHYPDELGSSITKYAEPFVGGGAVLFDIITRYDFQAVYISDKNAELINMYCCVRDNPSQLITLLKLFQSEYISLDEEQRKEYYYNKRDEYNHFKRENSRKIELAALFIFLNRTCFNGLYRVNSKGDFNVPMGKYKNPQIFDETNILAASKALQQVIILCADFTEADSFIDENTFVYFDPPYRPLNITSSFTSYTEQDFSDDNQRELAKFVKQMAERGAHILISNSDPKNVNEFDDFFDVIYEGMTIERVFASRMINSKADSRGKVAELLISNKSRYTMKQDFEQWLETNKSNIPTYSYYVDFEKVYRNVESIKIELNILNSMIGSQNIEQDFEKIIRRYPETLKCIPILLAKRESEISAQDQDGAFVFNFQEMNYSIEQYKIFMKKTGLFDLISKHIINNLVDYVLGIEVGLDSIVGRNRGAHQLYNFSDNSFAQFNSK